MIYTTNWNLVVKHFYYHNGNDRKTVLDGSQKLTYFIFFQYLCQWSCKAGFHLQKSQWLSEA